jgi:amino acid permease
MMQAILFILFITVLVLFFISRSDSEGKKSKIIFVVFVLAIVLFAFIYEYIASRSISKNTDVLNQFNQSQDIKCKGNVINNKTFLYVSGTQSFSGKPQSKHSGIVYDIKDCEK